MPKAARKWRDTSRRGPKGTYFSLRAGRDKNRVAISLAYVTERQADAACRQMNVEEARGQADVILAWHADARDDAVRYLIGDPDVRERFTIHGPRITAIHPHLFLALDMRGDRFEERRISGPQLSTQRSRGG